MLVDETALLVSTPTDSISRPCSVQRAIGLIGVVCGLACVGLAWRPKLLLVNPHLTHRTAFAFIGNYFRTSDEHSFGIAYIPRQIPSAVAPPRQELQIGSRRQSSAVVARRVRSGEE